MQFNPDTARKIMMAIEEYPHDRITEPLDIPSVDDETYSFHCRLLADAGFIEALNYGDMRGDFYSPSRITYKGILFLETFRNQSFWEKAKSTAKDRGVGFALDTLLEVGLKIIQQTIG